MRGLLGRVLAIRAPPLGVVMVGTRVDGPLVSQILPADLRAECDADVVNAVRKVGRKS